MKSTKQPTTVSAFSVLRISLGIVYLWFGALKFFQGISPAEQLATQTIHQLTFGLISDRVNIMLLASWECLIGILFIAGKWRKPALVLMFVHMACTFTPFLFFPDQTFRFMPYGLTMTGQYIMKNIVFIAAGIVLWKAEQTTDKQHTKMQEQNFAEEFSEDILAEEQVA